MKQQQLPNLKAHLKKRLALAIRLGGTSFLFALLLFAHLSQQNQIESEEKEAQPHTYYFSPHMDNHFANPSNWTPSYPGTHIGADQQVIIQGDANVPFYDLEIDGLMKICLDATLFSPENKIRVNSGGKINNDGEIIVGHIDQAGLISNNFTGRIDIYTYQAGRGSQTYNLMGGRIVVNNSFLNEGEFNNYGEFLARDEFTNTAQFRQLGGSKLSVRGRTMEKEVAEVLR